MPSQSTPEPSIPSECHGIDTIQQAAATILRKLQEMPTQPGLDEIRDLTEAIASSPNANAPIRETWLALELADARYNGPVRLAKGTEVFTNVRWTAGKKQKRPQLVRLARTNGVIGNCSVSVRYIAPLTPLLKCRRQTPSTKS